MTITLREYLAVQTNAWLERPVPVKSYSSQGSFIYASDNN